MSDRMFQAGTGIANICGITNLHEQCTRGAWKSLSFNNVTGTVLTKPGDTVSKTHAHCFQEIHSLVTEKHGQIIIIIKIMTLPENNSGRSSKTILRR
jgi:hypothetical protein